MEQTTTSPDCASMVYQTPGWRGSTWPRTSGGAHMGSWSPALATTAGVSGAFLTFCMAVPQAWAIWRDRTALGVSYTTWVLFCLSFSLWIGYSIRVSNEVILGSNILSLATASALMVGLIRAGEGEHSHGPWSLAALAAGCVALTLNGLFGPRGLVAVLLLSAVFVRAPQLVRSVRSYRAVAASEVSRTSWWLSLAGGACWMVHGSLRPDRNILLASIGVVVLSAAVLGFEYAAERLRTPMPIST